MAEKKAANEGMPEVVNNRELWDKHFATNPEYTRSVKRSGGFKITTVDAYRQIETATEQWGPFGHHWGVENAEWKDRQMVDPLGNTRTLGMFTGTFYYPGGSFPMSATEEILQLRTPREGAPYVFVDDEWTKKAFTNALTKALSYLGFNADIFVGLYDDNRYVAQRRMEENEAKKNPGESRAGTVARVMGDEVSVLVAKIQEFAMSNSNFISPEALATLPSLDASARQRPDAVAWLTSRYNQLISAVESRKKKPEPTQNEITY